MDLDQDLHKLRGQIKECEAQLADLKLQLAHAEARQTQYGIVSEQQVNGGLCETSRAGTEKSDAQPWPLSLSEYRRYGRQLIMPEVGIDGLPHSLLS